MKKEKKPAKDKSITQIRLGKLIGKTCTLLLLSDSEANANLSSESAKLDPLSSLSLKR